MSNIVILPPSTAGGGGGGVTGSISAGTTRATLGEVVWSNSNGVSFGVSGQTVTAIVGGATLKGMVLAPFNGNLPFAQSSISLGQNSLYIYPANLVSYLTLDHIRIPTLITNSSSAVSSGRKGQTIALGIYSRVSSDVTVLTRLYSTTYTIAVSYSSNLSWAQSMITAIGNSTSYNSVTASSAGLNLSASLHGPRELIVPVSTLLAPGEYWFALLNSTSSAGTVGACLNISNLAVAYQTFNRLGASTNATGSGFYQFMGHGTYSATTASMPANISMTQINQLGTLPILFAATGSV